MTALMALVVLLVALLFTRRSLVVSCSSRLTRSLE
ncbi:MAG: hypothetical protein F4126_01260 [Acidimicrobiaceae bacterium]|nr:hypothetical protein [Acidimicrobiaceae bacterium]MYB85603.1 hypothetical protein [Acidimicrobiaceae bacterium]MYH92322.1 hypothetical protein [Acidimicrobiaceae bacterium]MYK76494.1 hypothetical protein [Acidimicrobiaceae bacterium]